MQDPLFLSSPRRSAARFRTSRYETHYYPSVPMQSVGWDGEGLRGFFWPRKQELNWSHIRPLLEGTSWSSFHIHKTDNLSEVSLDLTDQEAMSLPLKWSSWFDSPEEYGRVLQEQNVFFAPRRYEGIGMSFLEAMSLGMAVISPDNPTMNEYISSGETGYLYDPDNPALPPWKQAQSWGEAARRQCILGREAWLRAVPHMIESLLEPDNAPSHTPHEARRTQAILNAWPKYVRYCLFRFLIRMRNFLFLILKKRREKN